MPPTNNGSTEDVQPPVVQIQTRNPNPEPNVAPVWAILASKAILNSKPPQPPSPYHEQYMPGCRKSSNTPPGKDLFPLPFMDQNARKTAGNDTTVSFDCFSGYFRSQMTQKIRKDNIQCPITELLHSSYAFGYVMLRCDKTMCFWADAVDILKPCHSDLLGLYGANYTSRKIVDSGSIGPHLQGFP
ncbi:hypothetical protein Tco_0454295 [Tanacetum coccineum]